LVAVALLAPAATAQAATFTVTTTADSGPGSLRQAITAVNSAGAGNTIAFAIPGPGPHVIAPTTALPSLASDGTTIDGCTQPEADCDARPLKLQVQLHGQALAPYVTIGSTIRGLSLTGPGTGIELVRGIRDGYYVASQDVTVERNLIGIAPDGSAAGKTRAISIPRSEHYLARDRLRILDNVIGSSTTAAIDFSNATLISPVLPLLDLEIARNVIGLDPTATQPRPNAGDGIVVGWSAGAKIVDNTIANSAGVGIRHRGRMQAIPGSDPVSDPGLLISGNLVEDNAGGGIVLEDSTVLGASKDANTGPARVFGNTIRDNGAAGVTVRQATGTLRPSFQIGGTATGQANTITANDGPGVAVGNNTADTSVAVTVRGNAIYANTGPAIDLASDGPTANADPLVVRTGPNRLLNHPLLTSIAHGSVIVNGTYAGAANATYTLDVYASETAASPSTWIGSAPITTDAGGVALFSVELPGDLSEGSLVHATATDADGNTSELSQIAAVAPPRPQAPEPEPEPEPAGPGPGPGPSTSPTPIDQQPPTTDPGPRDNPSSAAKARLRLTQSVNRPTLLAGQQGTLTIRVTNPSRSAARNVRTCVRLAFGLVAVRTAPKAHLSRGRFCWATKRLAAHDSKRYRLTVRALPGASGRQIARATASSTNARTTARATRTLRVVARTPIAGGVTG
jgi:uncharacterized repeat protein (TIGR01451 family)